MTVNLLITEFEVTITLWIPQRYPWILKLLTRHKHHCSYIVQICDSNYNLSIVMALSQ